MALIKCPDCRKKISQRADRCPHCGYILEEKDRVQDKSIVPVIVFAVSFSIVLICGVFATLYYLNEKRIKEEDRKIAYEEFNHNFKIYLDIADECCIDFENIITYEKEVWYNCIREINDSRTDKFTKGKNGQFYNNFNEALESWHLSIDFQTLKENVTYSQEKETKLYKKLNACNLNLKEVKSKKSAVKIIHGLLREVDYFNNDGGYNYEEYDSKTNGYVSKISNKIEESKEEFD